MKQLNGHTKQRAFWVQGMAILSLSAALQAYNCKGEVSKMLNTEIPDYIIAHTDNSGFSNLMATINDISQPIKTNNRLRDWLYATVSSGDRAKVKVILDRLNKDKQSSTNYQNKDFPNLVSQSGKTALGKAIEKGHNDIVKDLIDNQHIDIHKADKKQKTPLHVAAFYNKEEGFKLIWNKILAQDKANAIQHLFKKDEKGHSVFASAYLPEPRLFSFSNPNLKMFAKILGIVKDSLKEDDLKNITKEIMDLKHNKKISQKYVGKLQYEITLIDHPGPPAQPKKEND